ncbi:LysR family transcriptional regulator [Gymnodinialimonas sp. 2305UL16-5]|uniref:LysR family transcriptional regulator n=1 Tax=Gymnodinialimonas mytili TaxID=3126503 RepID=UPI0030B3477B
MIFMVLSFPHIERYAERQGHDVALQHVFVACAASLFGFGPRSIRKSCKLRLRKLPMSDFVWDDLKYFVTVASEGSVASAARMVNVEHSTVVRRITRLESALNVRLFNRLVRGWVLTEEGRLLQSQAAAIEGQMLAIQRSALSLGKISGRVTLTAPPEFLSEVVIRALRGFQDEYPEIELCLFGEMREANLSRGEADVALRMVNVEGAELVTQRICDVDYHFYGTKSLLKTRPKMRRVILYSESHQPQLTEALLRQAVGRSTAFQTNNLRTALRAASNGVGIALLPSFLAATAPDLQVIEEPVAPIIRPVYLVMQRDVRNSDRVRALTEYLKQNLAKALAPSV